ncbi:response regulator [Leptothoe spongobia]|uniref:Response regulator n=1 Tax=Leptothoe spongobia TAU-MAC 1115 TaxID=1967444 RepID=A0A947GHT0_9CYAN|nr:response regulator [Leptothoe spongobia]MBT9315159.1 response regulator [Leptothoe spongobia TAU-MAC 1115]
MNTISPLNSGPILARRKPRLLVVDDEPDNLDLLYRTFRREYQVLRAESGRQALEVLEDDGEVAVIISDQRMPEMTGTEFLSKTVPEFPDTVRIILTGFTDVEDLVQAINNGQVYRYITKPWEPDTLRQLVQQAANTYELLKQSNHALYVAQHQAQLMNRVAELGNIDIAEADALQFIADGWGQILSTRICAIQCLEENNVTLATFGDLCGQNLLDNALVQNAISTRTMQVLPDVSASNLNDSLYRITATRSHLVVPVVFHERLLAVVSFHWEHSYRNLDDVRDILTIPTNQMAQALIANRCL